ncbi:DUF6894 family protein [Enterovirga sp. CN4-39]|uniref:DUF6894 family protein n=1 Tax=Enterovirga sp. CN4-39 TaxID=3400910 RepID=UPI003C03E475
MRCFFNLLGPEGAELLDEVGVEVSSLDDARTEALKAMAELRAESPGTLAEWNGWVLRIVDDGNSTLADLPLSMILPLRSGKDAVSRPT